MKLYQYIRAGSVLTAAAAVAFDFATGRRHTDAALAVMVIASLFYLAATMHGRAVARV